MLNNSFCFLKIIKKKVLLLINKFFFLFYVSDSLSLCDCLKMCDFLSRKNLFCFNSFLNKKKDKMPKFFESHFKEPLHVMDGGLTQRSVRMLSLAEDPHEPTEITTVTTLPTFLLPSYWIAHHLTAQDVQALLNNVPARLLWLSCLVNGLDVIPSCLKPSQTKMTEILISYRKQAFDALVNCANLMHHASDRMFTQIFQRSESNAFYFPIVEFSHDEIYRVMQFMPVEALKSFCVNKIEKVFEWNGEAYLPTHLHNKDMIVLRRLVHYEQWQKSHAATTQYGIVSVPLVVRYKSELFVICEDGFHMKQR